MKMISNNKKISGIIYRGKRYAGVPVNPSIKHIARIANVRIDASAKAEQTTGYPITFSYKTGSFKLYKTNDLFHALDHVPIYQFVLKNITDTIINGLTLVYEGNNLFHIEGTLNLPQLYVSTKNSLTEIAVCLVDEYGNLFASTLGGLISQTVATTSETVSFTSSTLTTDNSMVYSEVEEEIEFPFLIQSFKLENKIYLTRSDSTILETGVYFEHEIL